MPRFENEAYVGLVLSSKAHAEILSVDPSEALTVEGVYGFMSAKDMDPKKNKYCSAKVWDEEIFASEKVRWLFQLNKGIKVVFFKSFFGNVQYRFLI